MTNVISYKFTKEGYEKLKKEMDDLIKRRPIVVVHLTEAREQGDLSENAGYHAAKDELGQIDSRIREIKILLRFGKVVESNQNQTVQFGSQIVLEAGGQKFNFTIVSEFEADPAKDKISDVSPIGRALLGKEVGDFAEITTPGGTVKYKVLEVKM